MGTHEDIANVAETYHTGDFTYGQYDCGAFACLCLNRSGNGIGVSQGTSAIWNAANAQHAVVDSGGPGGFAYGEVTRGDIVLTSESRGFGCFPTRSHAQVALGGNNYISSWGNNGDVSKEPHRHSGPTGGNFPNGYWAICRWGTTNGKSHRYSGHRHHSKRQKAKKKKNKVVKITKKPKQYAHVGSIKKKGKKYTVNWKISKNATSKKNKARQTSQRVIIRTTTKNISTKKKSKHTVSNRKRSATAKTSSAKINPRNYYPYYYTSKVTKYYKLSKHKGKTVKTRVKSKKTIARLKKMNAKTLKKKGYKRETNRVRHQHKSTLTSVTATIVSQNKKGKSKGSSTKLTFAKPNKPKISVTYADGQVKFTIETKKDNGDSGKHRNRADTAWELYGRDSLEGKGFSSKKLKKLKTGHFSGTKQTITQSVSYFMDLQAGEKAGIQSNGSHVARKYDAKKDWIHLQCRAYNRGLAGNSSRVKKDYWIGYPQSVWIPWNDKNRDKKHRADKIAVVTTATHAEQNIYVPLDYGSGGSKSPLKEIQLQRLTNSEYDDPDNIPSSASWTDVSGAKAKGSVHPKGLCDSLADAFPDRGKHLWYRVKYSNDVFTVYSQPVRAVKIERADIKPGRISTMTLSPTDDGKALMVDLTFGESDKDKEGGTPGVSIEHADAKYAWRSSSQPTASDVTWTVDDDTLTKNEIDPGKNHKLWKVNKDPFDIKKPGEYDIAYVPASGSTDDVPIASKAWVWMPTDSSTNDKWYWYPLKKTVFYISGLTSGETYYANARRYIDPIENDPNSNSKRTYGPRFRSISNPLSCEVVEAPGAVTLSLPESVQAGKTVQATWTHESEAVQKAWTLYHDMWKQADDSAEGDFPDYDTKHVSTITNEVLKVNPAIDDSLSPTHPIDFKKAYSVDAILKHANDDSEETVSLTKDISYVTREDTNSIELLHTLPGYKYDGTVKELLYEEIWDEYDLPVGTDKELEYTPIEDSLYLEMFNSQTQQWVPTTDISTLLSVDYTNGTVNMNPNPQLVGYVATHGVHVFYKIKQPVSAIDLGTPSTVENELICENTPGVEEEWTDSFPIDDIDLEDIDEWRDLSQITLGNVQLYFADQYGNRIEDVDSSAYSFSVDDQKLTYATTDAEDSETGVLILDAALNVQNAEYLCAKYIALTGAKHKTVYDPQPGTSPEFFYYRPATSDEVTNGDYEQLADDEETPIGYQAGHRQVLVRNKDYYWDSEDNTVIFAVSTDWTQCYAEYTTTADISISAVRMTYTPKISAPFYVTGDQVTYKSKKYICNADNADKAPGRGASAVVASGTDAYGAYQLSAEQISDLIGTGNQLVLHVGVRTSLTGKESYSDPKICTVVQDPQVGVSCVDTLTAQPLTLNLTSLTANVDAVIRIESAGVAGAEPDGYHIQAQGDSVYSATVDAKTLDWTEKTEGSGVFYASFNVPTTREFIDLGGYTVYVAGRDTDTGVVSEEASAEFDVKWAHQAVAPEVYIRTSEEQKLAVIDIMPGDDGSVSDTDTVELYRVTPDGAELIADGLEYNTTVTDRFAPYGAIHSWDEDVGVDLKYRVATRTEDGDVNWDDIDYELYGYALRLEWGDSDNDMSNGEGGMVELPFNLDMKDKYAKNFEARQHWDGVQRGYWNPGYSRTPSFSVVIPANSDADTKTVLKALGQYDGPVFVRTPYGDAYEANVELGGYDTTHNNPVISVSIDSTALGLDDAFKPTKEDIVPMTEDL